jgi:EAL domain-containing protein (putative c-di-GMP-specific phosphodiesterase class I)
VSGQRLQCAGSVGAAIYGSDGLDADELLHKADLALYRAKSEGRATFSFYDAGTDLRLQHRRALTRDLRHAVQDEHLSLHFQPQYERDGTTLSGYEALVRWVHPKLGNIPPSDFIPLAEETGIIEELGRWVLRQACREAARWPSSLSVSVNLSAVQFRIGDLSQTVAEALDEARLSPLRLELEITESLLISDTEHAIGTLQRLAIMGVRIAMDDFGTGYSSLAYLWRFPFDKVKIDRSFTQHMERDPKVDLIVRSIISLAHSLNIRVNAEGVESPAQLSFLQRYGCDELQGFLLGRPAPVEQLRHTGATATPRQLPPRAQTDYMRLETRFATTQ